MFILGTIGGMFFAWVWLTYGSPYARKNNAKAGVQVRCYHCGRMYTTSYGQVRVDTKCITCM